MNTLYPIIRRKRRPLIEENAEMLKPETLKAERVEPGNGKAEIGKAESRNDQSGVTAMAEKASDATTTPKLDS